MTAEAHDLRINRGAVDAQLQWTGNHDAVQNKRPGREDLEAFETTYNAACGSVARGELGQAEVLLKRAKGIPVAISYIFTTDQRIRALQTLGGFVDRRENRRATTYQCPTSICPGKTGQGR